MGFKTPLALEGLGTNWTSVETHNGMDFHMSVQIGQSFEGFAALSTSKTTIG